ncbi:hypothetical protein [Mongoliimonas terrestris]|uniref:hypothetical protein n=1 Tax=Mongoliimonas terrestris TaxID=1709001 RepID=UPI0009498EE8|nr:hypothetical protein [Mongoliimonas terrestris]
MKFEYMPASVRETTEGPRFRIGRLTVTEQSGKRDVTSLIDASYDYASPRELRWHLADRFRLPAKHVLLQAA